MATFRQKYKLCEVVHYACEDVFDTILRHDAVFLAGIPDTEEALLKSFCYQNGKTIYLQAELEDVIIATSQQHVIDDTLFLCIRRVELSFLQRFMKRLADIVISLLGLIVTSPVMLLAALFIALTSPGPVFFRQKRATIGGRVFDIVKFRTMQDAIWCDIGDSQNISQNLSTFSGHITNVIRILDGASSDSLVLLDELGSGTDPAEGMGIAIAVLEELRRRGCMYLVTTHYPQVKIYAEKTERVRSARMAFDPLTLAPQYRLEMDRSGESCALLIAARLGLAPSLIARAKQEVYGEHDDHKQPCTALPVPPSRLVRYQPPKENRNPSGKFTMGDSVQLLPGLETGIVYRPADDAGNVIVQVRDQKRAVNHTRLRLQVPASELYPPDYDFSVVFDTVANRKAAHILSKRYDDRAQRVYEANEGIIGGKE